MNWNPPADLTIYQSNFTSDIYVYPETVLAQTASKLFNGIYFRVTKNDKYINNRYINTIICIWRVKKLKIIKPCIH